MNFHGPLTKFNFLKSSFISKIFHNLILIIQESIFFNCFSRAFNDSNKKTNVMYRAKPQAKAPSGADH